MLRLALDFFKVLLQAVVAGISLTVACAETTAIPFVGMLACIAIFPTEKALFFHEWKSSGRQSVLTFLSAYTVQETSVSIVASLVSPIPKPPSPVDPFRSCSPSLSYSQSLLESSSAQGEQ